MKKKRYPLFLVYFGSFIFMEVIFKLFAVQNFFSFSWVYILFLLAFFSFLLTFFSSLGHHKTNMIVTNVLLFGITIWYCAEVVFKRSFQVYFSLSTTLFADQAVSFLDKVVEMLLTNFIPIILLFIPLILSLIFRKKIDYTKKTSKYLISLIGLSMVTYLFFFGMLFIAKEKENSPSKLYFELNNNALNKETFGALPSVFMEIRKIIWPPQTKLYPNDPTGPSTPIVYDKNILELDFEALANMENDVSLKQMHEYFVQDEGTLKNEYTGLFKDYNLILLMGESFNSIAVSEELTPTLYKLTHEGFVFENFYSPVILSTIGGEFQELTGLYPNLSKLSNVWRKGKNAFPFGFGNVFGGLGYKTQAYHDHRYDFQDRNLYLASIGLTNYMGCNNGLENKINCKKWPESDLEMINATVGDYINQDNFFTYYVTVSGHMSYNFTSNAMAIKNKEAVKDLPYSEDIKAYLASNIELDKALESLLKKLDESGKLSKTVIALAADHYPYDISLEHINEIALPPRDKTIEINRSNFILWNSEMKTTPIKKVGGNMDILPTILNLFGASYDSRLIMGRDLLSTSDGLVIFADASWITDEGSYFASSNTFVPKDPEKDYNGYVEKINKTVANRINLSKLIIEKDYYRKVVSE